MGESSAPQPAARLRWLTPPGRAAVAVLALEGARARPCPLRRPGGAALDWPAPDRFGLAHLVVPDGEGGAGTVLDEVVVLGTAAGAELHLHGGTGLADTVVEALAAAGFAPPPDAGAGDTGGRDSAALLSAAGSLTLVRAAASARWGPLAELVDTLEHGAADAAHDDDLDRRLRRALALGRRAEAFRRPPRVRLVGRPNAGKSTLFNALLVEDRALVSPEAGTTRDRVCALTRCGDVPVQLEDTAGEEPAPPGASRDDAGPCELLVHLTTADDEPAWPAPPGVPVLRVRGRVDERGGPGVSGRTGDGVAALRARLAAALGLPGTEEDDVLTPVDEGQHAALRRARPGGG